MVGRESIPHLVGLVVSCLIVVTAFSSIVFFGHTLSTAGSGRAPGTNGYAPFPGQPSPDSYDFRLDPGASAWAHEPWAEVTHRAYAEGEIPLWNPYQAAGAPHAANMQSAVFDLLLLGVNLHPTPLIWDLSMVAAFMLGAAAAYLFGRILGLGVVPAVVSSAAFSLSGYFFLYSNNHFSRSYVFLPLLFLLVELVLRSRRFLPVFGLASAVAANIYIGMPEASFFVIGSASVYAVVRLVQGRTTTAMRISIARLGGAGVVGLLLASPLVLMFLEYESLSFNIHKPEFARGSETAPAWGVLHWIVPWFPGAPEPPRNWVGAAVGISALVAVSGRYETKRLHAWFFFTLGTLLLVKSYDFEVLEWVGRVPVVKLVVFPAYAAAVVSFAFAVLAGIGVQVLWNRDLRLRRFLTLVVSVSIVLVVVLTSSDRLLVIVEEVQTVWIRGAFFAVLAIAAVVLASRLGGRWGAVVFAGVILSELAMLVPSDGYPKRAEPYLTPGWMTLVRTAQGGEPHSRVFALDGKLYPNTAGALGLQDIRVLDAMYIGRYVRYVRTFLQPDMFDRFTGEEANPRLNGNPMFDALGVRAVLSKRDLANVPDFRFLGRDRDTRVYENTSAYPRAWIVHDVHVVGDEDDAFEFLQARARRSDGAFIVNGFDPRREAVVEHDRETTDQKLRALQGGRTQCNAGRDRTTIERYSAGSVTLRVDAACAGLLVLPDTYFPGWKATVNGRVRAIYPTDGAFRGLTVPKGTSRVEFRYEPRAFPIGIALAVAGLVAFAVIWLVSGWRRRSRARSEMPPTCRHPPTPNP
jgi:Bacterial membrane protein YfhO